MNFDSTTLIVVGSICFSTLLIDGILLAIILVARRGVAKAANWSSTMGTVMSSTIVWRRRSKGGSVAYPSILYNYLVMGSPYQGSSITPGMAVGGSGAHKVVERYPAGAQVLVYYDPNNPSDAVLERGMPDYIKWLWITIVLVTIFLFALGIVLAIMI